MASKRRALVSVSDKTGIVDFCKGLVELGFEVISTGGTLKALTEAGVPARQVSEVTGVPEILGGRVKTLHPTIFGGILARRDEAGDMDTIADHGMDPIDVVAVNLYPFAQTVANPKSTDPEIIEQIDIGGPSLIRAAAKNHKDVYVVVDPADYNRVLEALSEGREADHAAFHRRLAGKVFAHTAEYDRLIAEYMQRPAGEEEAAEDAAPALPASLNVIWAKTEDMRYGENPHQAAAFYADPTAAAPSMAHMKQLQGKALSYNNYMDGETALEMIREFPGTACVILKHANPCGAAIAETPLEAYRRALSCDSTSAFGGIAGLNRPVEKDLAGEIVKTFMEVIIAPSFSPEAVEIFSAKKNLRLLEAGEMTPRTKGYAFRALNGGMLVQETDLGSVAREDMKIVTKTQPTEEDWQGLEFGWRVCKWVKSNAIVYSSANRILGVGAGQMSRVDAAKFGLEKAVDGVMGGYCASDAFFPFRDVVDLCAKAGIKAIIQPGGSIRDDESIKACDEHGIAMVFTGMRHFRH